MDIKEQLNNYKSLKTPTSVYSQKLLVSIHDKYDDFKKVEEK